MKFVAHKTPEQILPYVYLSLRSFGSAINYFELGWGALKWLLKNTAYFD